MTLFSRLRKAVFTESGAVRAMLTALQDAITRTADGAARTSIRLGSITGQIRRTNGALTEMLSTAGALNDDIQRVAGSFPAHARGCERDAAGSPQRARAERRGLAFRARVDSSGYLRTKTGNNANQAYQRKRGRAV